MQMYRTVKSTDKGSTGPEGIFGFSLFFSLFKDHFLSIYIYILKKMLHQKREKKEEKKLLNEQA